MSIIVDVNLAKRRRVLPSLLCAAAVASALLVAAPAAGAGASAANRLRTDLSAVVDQGATSALAVVRSGRTVEASSAGPRRHGHPGAVDPTGRFRAGSVTKSFLATVVLQLVESRRVRLDDPVDRYVHGVRAGNRITVRMLLNHTSGLYNLTKTLPLDPPSGFLDIRWRHWQPRELLDRANAHRLDFAPGKGWAYSDTNYLVLGLLIQHVTGHSPATEITRRILAPLHLHDTTLPTQPRLRGPHAHAYLPTPDGTLADITDFDPSVLRYGGELVSSGADLNRFFRALTGGRLLRPATLRLMRTVTAPARGYGLGLRHLPLTCGTALGHDGDVPGASTWSFTRAGRSVTVSMTWGTDRPKDAVLDLIDHALCR